MTIPALPDAPALGDSPEAFNTKAFAFVAALDDWGTAANAVAAAVDADATAADADAATATTQAGIATTKANEAAASAVDANSAELAAQAAQTAAELAATNAAASYDAFDDRYLGAKSSDPSVDNDGGALIIGALYFNTTDQKMKVYATLGWKDAGSAVNGTARRQSFTATAGQTSFAVTDGYDANFADVYLNGVKLVNGVDVTVTSGTAVVLASGAAAGDSVDVIAYGAFEVANTYTQAQADALLAGKIGTGSGTVSQSNLATNVAGTGPAFSAYQSSPQSLTGGVYTKLQFQTEEFDTNNNFDSATNYRFTPTVAGYYQVNCVFTTASGQVAIYLYKNGAAFKAGPSILATTYSTIVSALVYFNGSTDYVEAYAFVGVTASTSATQSNTYFQASMVRAA